MTTPTGGRIVRFLHRLRWKNVVSAVALGTAVWMQFRDPEHFGWSNLVIWLGVAISGHIVSKIPSPGGEK